LGDKVDAGEPLLEVETDKGVNPVESVAGGVVLRRLFEDGAKVGAGEVIAWVGQPGDPIPGAASAGAPAAAAPAAPAAQTTPTPAGTPRVSPVVRSLAERYGVDLAAIRGTGPGGMATREDVLRAKEGGPARGAAAALPAAPPRPAAAPSTFTANQAAVARKVAQSHREKPTFHVTVLVDMSAVVAHREAAKRAAGGAPAWDAYLVAAAGSAISAFPAFRRWMHGEEVREHATVDVAFAVGSADELAAPVVRGADRKTVAQAAADVAVLAVKARACGLGTADTAESCFLVSNLGMLPIEGFDAIVYPEHAAALAAGAVAPTPVARPDGSIAVLPLVRLTLTVDHRLVNGMAAAAFLSRVKDYLEQGAFA
jgi:pyruvate dehydrogenase E2 component (dihydrolipoamide acetyltransferase)